MSLPGVDLSNWQGTPADWRPQAGAIEWAAVKVTELSTGGPYANPDAAADLEFLKAAGKGRVLYHFGHPDTSPGESARFFLGEVSRLGLEDTDAVALDLEVTGNKPPGQVAAWALDVLAMLQKALDRTPLLYTFIAFAEAGNCAGLGRWPLWIADPSSPAGHPRVPHPWGSWAIHQWKQQGIDRDVAAYATLADMQHALGKAHVDEITHTADGKTSLVRIAQEAGSQPSSVLRRTAVHDGRYAPELAQWLNAVFAGHLPATAPVPAGVKLRVPS